MRSNKGSGSQVELNLSNDERYLIKQCLNECCHGFRLPDFSAKIGAEKAVVSRLLDQLDGATGSPHPGADGLSIRKIGDDEFRVELTTQQARIFVNCMNETERALGAKEFPTRFGASLDEVKALFAVIEAALK